MYCLGYDPVGKRFKVLCMISSSYDERLTTHLVLTLESRKPFMENEFGKSTVMMKSWNKRVLVFLVLWNFSTTEKMLEIRNGSSMSWNCLLPRVTGTDEIVFSTYSHLPASSCRLVFYNMERNTFTRVKIEGLEVEEAKVKNYIDTFIDYAENVEFM
ncbi:unnamed protein product [Eruca vesicaria subsp. sativa]|uniref:F-box associated beta-propeller type 3 domain-containing protein n=1 Tax=Eruca vesicaria subsp. sativa TaxID=29727 RepID=A0ABC8KNQ5_ERUVS|nr:unnamed protein product [Eruca vesicaria subsp. sativa]